MIEKVNPQHPDKVADRIAGAIVDLAYRKQENPKIAVEVLIGHGVANVIIESSVKLTEGEVTAIVERITGRDDIYVALIRKEQDKYLAKNQQGNIRCGDNGIFKGVPLTDEERKLSKIAHDIYAQSILLTESTSLQTRSLLYARAAQVRMSYRMNTRQPSSTLLVIGAEELTLMQVLQTANSALIWLSL